MTALNMTGEQSPFGPRGIAGGPLTEIEREPTPQQLAELLAHIKPTPRPPGWAKFMALEVAIEPIHRDARAFVGEL